MNEKLQAALDQVELTYSELVAIANDIMKPYTEELNNLISDIEDNIDNLSVDQIRRAMLQLSLKSFRLGDIKEKSALKSNCAEALRKEAYARAYAGAEGAQNVRESTATIATATQMVTDTLYNLIASLFKTKLDEVHRCVDTLKSVLMSRMAEQKLMASYGACSTEGEE